MDRQIPPPPPSGSPPQPWPQAPSADPPPTWQQPPPAQPYTPSAPATCYRHPDRATGLRCTRCNHPVCGECVRPASVGQLCPDCLAEGRQRVITAQQLRDRAGASTTPVTFGLLALNVVVFLLSYAVPDFAVLREFQQSNAAIRGGEWWRILTAAFLHAGLLHLAFNMYALYILGPEMERRAGSFAFAAMWFASAAAGGLAYLFFGGPGPAVGASGAVFGLFGAWLAMAVRDRQTSHGAAQLRQLLVLLAINLALPLFVPQIAWQAHLGGLIAGFGIAAIWTAAPEGKAGNWMRVVPGVVLLIACVGLAALL